MRTNDTSSGRQRAARATTKVRRSSLLPAPVVPTTRAWGPSRSRSSSTSPSAATPMGARGRPPLATQPATTPSGSSASAPMSSSKRSAVGRRRALPCSGSSRRASARATSAAVDAPAPTSWGVPTVYRPSTRRDRHPPSPRARSLRCTPPGRSLTRSARTMAAPRSATSRRAAVVRLANTLGSSVINTACAGPPVSASRSPSCSPITSPQPTVTACGSLDPPPAVEAVGNHGNPDAQVGRAVMDRQLDHE